MQGELDLIHKQLSGTKLTQWILPGELTQTHTYKQQTMQTNDSYEATYTQRD